MTHAHAPRRRPGRPVGPAAGCADCPTDAVPVRRSALPGLAVPAGGAPVIRRQKADAVRYADRNDIDIVVSQQTVADYVNDTSNDRGLRKGLLDAWNLNAQSRWVIDTPADLAGGSDNPFHHSNFAEYQDFTKASRGVSVDAFGGPVSAFYNRGAPKIGSKSGDWGDSDLGDRYGNYVTGLRSGGQSDADIAQALLDQDDSVLQSDLERRAAAMMTVTVYLAEEWRKQGAAKIYRAHLRLIAGGQETFEQFLRDFAFVASAQAGRKQVGRFYDVHNGDADLSDMDSDEQQVYGAMSPTRDEDFSSDDDMRTDDKKNLKGNRFFAEKYQ